MHACTARKFTARLARPGSRLPGLYTWAAATMPPLRTSAAATEGHKAFTDLRARNNAGEEVSFDVFADKVVLVVNVARL